MKLRSLEYFLVLSEELHFGKAAKRLCITQPPLSTAIKSLEEELGVTLFKRNKISVELTEVGTAFVTEVENILESTENAKSLVRAIESGSTGRINIGFCGSLIFRDIIAFINKFKEQNPKIEIILHELTSQQQIESLEKGKIDFGFSYGKANHNIKINSIPWKDDEFCICLNKSHPLSHKNKISLNEIKEENFIIFERNINTINFDQIMQIYHNSGSSPKFGLKTKNWMTSISIVSEGFGVTIIPKSFKKMNMENVALLEIEGNSIKSKSSLIWRSINNKSQDIFLDYCKKNILNNSVPDNIN